MKFLRLAQKYCAFLGISSTKKPCNRLTLMILLNLIESLVFICVFHILEANSFGEYMDAIFSSTASISFTIQFGALVCDMENLFIVFTTIDKIGSSRSKRVKSKAMYEKTYRQIEKLTEMIIFMIAKITPICVIWPKVILCYSLYFTTDSGNGAFEMPIQLWLPFDVQHPFVYLFVVTYQFILTAYAFLFMACVLSIGIGAFLFQLTVIADIKRNLRSINEYAKNQRYQLHTRFNELFNTIQLYSNTKQLVVSHVKVYSPMYVTLFAFSVITICIVMLMIQIELENFQMSAMFWMRIFLVCYAFDIVFVVCELGQRMTNAFEEINDVIGKFKWYLFPDKLKRIMPFIIHFAQRPVDIEFFGRMSCSRNTFKEVMNKAYSYFMVLREFRK